MDALEDLRIAAASRRAARDRVATARWRNETHSPEFDALRRELAVATDHWASLIPRAAAAGHTLADVARAAGVAAPSLYYRLRAAAGSDDASVSSSIGETDADQQNQVRP